MAPGAYSLGLVIRRGPGNRQSSLKSEVVETFKGLIMVGCLCHLNPISLRFPSLPEQHKELGLRVQTDESGGDVSDSSRKRDC